MQSALEFMIGARVESSHYRFVLMLPVMEVGSLSRQPSKQREDVNNR